MVRQPIFFGGELRRRRLAADLSLTDLARLVHYSKAQLSKVERGLKAPSRDLVRLCDAALDASGALAALAPGRAAGVEPLELHADEKEVWSMRLSADGQSWFEPMSRRQVMAGGAASMMGMSIGMPGTSIRANDSTLLGTSRSLFDQYRKLGQVTDPGLVLPALIAQTHMLREFATGAGGQTRQEFLKLGSRYAEYVGWLIQESGNEPGALWWTQRAVDLAAAGGDHNLAAYALVRRALVTLYREDAGQTVELVRRAQEARLPSRIRGLAFQREAQGHAMAGDYDACMRSLDRARTLLAHSPPEQDTPVIGTTNLSDPIAMISGWCLYDLGRPREAADTLDQQIAQVPSGALRTQVRYGVRRALAHASAGEVEHACGLTGRLLDSAMTVRSATIAVDLRKLARTLARHPKNPAARELIPQLTTALQAMAP